MYNFKFSVSLTKESKYSEILLNKNDKCLFSYIYIYILTFTLKGFKVIYPCTKAWNMETTVNSKCDNYIKQMFRTCQNVYKTFIISFSWRFANRIKLYQKVYMWRKIIVSEILQRNFVTADTRKSWITNCDYAIS